MLNKIQENDIIKMLERSGDLRDICAGYRVNPATLYANKRIGDYLRNRKEIQAVKIMKDWKDRGMTQLEVAEKHGISVGSVKTALNNAVKFGLMTRAEMKRARQDHWEAPRAIE
jgi:uncharacterized protein (DUF2062 family)